MEPLLLVEDLAVEIGDRPILENINLEIKPGEVHVLFGPNGSGKSSLLGTIMGFPRYRVVRGKIYFRGEDITGLPVEERAARGIGLAFQRPPALKGVLLGQLLKRFKGDGEKARLGARELNLEDFLDREVNLGFSGGETKRSEILQLWVQDPQLALLDEPESGVDVENLALIGRAINYLLERESPPWEGKPLRELRRTRSKGGLIITHTGHILNYVEADVGHVLFQGSIRCSGNPRELFSFIQKMGYSECIRCVNSREVGENG